MMLIERFRRWLIIGLCALGVGVSGCTMVRLGYGSADDLAYLWLDGWFDFNDEQTPKARAALADALMWHRKTQLPDYAQWLAKTSSDVANNTTADAVCKLSAEVYERFSRMSDRMLPAAAEIAVTLTDAQLAHMQARFDKGQVKFRDEYAKGDAKTREAAALERSISRAESVYGNIDDAQREVLAQAIKTSPFDATLMLGERATRMREAIQIVKDARAMAASGAKSAAVAQFQGAIKRWAQEGRTSPRSGYRAYQQRTNDYNCALSAQVHNVASAATRQGARERLKGWESDARSLFAQAAP